MTSFKIVKKLDKSQDLEDLEQYNFQFVIFGGNSLDLVDSIVKFNVKMTHNIKKNSIKMGDQSPVESKHIFVELLPLSPVPHHVTIN